MSQIVISLRDSLSNSIFSTLLDIVPWLLLIVPIAIGIYFIKDAIDFIQYKRSE